MSTTWSKATSFFGLREEPLAGDEERQDSALESFDSSSEASSEEDSQLLDYPGNPAKPAHDLTRIVTMRPTSLNECGTICEELRAGTPIVLNMESLQERQAQRILDFASGAVSALEGSMQRSTKRVFLLSPKQIKIVGGDNQFGELFDPS